MLIQKNNSCRMGGPEKGQWATIILIRASTGVCHVKSFQGLIFFRHNYYCESSSYLSSSSPGSKEKNTNLLS